MSLESFTYGVEKIGGAASTHGTSVLDSFMFVTNEDEAEFVCRFVVAVTPSGTALTDFNALAAACQAVEAALRMRYQKLTVDWGASNQETFDPDVNAGTFPSSGFSQEPNLRKLDDFPNSGEARGYEFRVRMGQYPNYSDAFGAAAGRRQVDVSLHYDVNDRLAVSFSGVWTQVPANLARKQFLAQLDGVSGYAAYRLSLINATDAVATGATWTRTRRDESDPNDLSTLTFSREYSQHVNGRRGSTVEIFYDRARIRTVTIRGDYLRTISGAGGTYGNVFGTAGTSLANFLDNTNGGQAYAEATQLPGLTTAQGGPLTVGQNCELLTEPNVTTNEQVDRTTYSLVYQELIQKQSQAAGNFLDDPNIVGDTIKVSVSFNELDDSPAAPPASSVAGPTGSSPGGGSSSPVSPGASSAAPTTVSPVAATNPSTTSRGGGGAPPASSAVVPTKPVELLCHYEATFNKDGVLDCYAYWKGEVLPLLLETLDEEFGLGGGTELVTCSETTDRTKNVVSADLHVRAYTSNVVNFIFTQGVTNVLGVRADPAFTGEGHDYLVQQGLPRTTMTRFVEAIFKTGTFSLDQFVTPPSLGPGWVPIQNAQPNTKDVVKGIPAQGVPVQPLTYATLVESLLWVRKNVAGSGGGGAPRIATGVNGTPTAGIDASMPVGPAVATGQG